MKNYEPGFADRLNVAAKAKRGQIVKAKANNPAKLADAARKAEEEIAREAALKAEEERQAAEVVKQAADKIAHEAERKAERDRRYAARKARKR